MSDLASIYGVDTQLTTQSGGSVESMPIGTIIQSYSINAPNSYLLCNGQQFDALLYPDLYTLLGTNVTPDLRDKVLKYNS